MKKDPCEFTVGDLVIDVVACYLGRPKVIGIIVDKILTNKQKDTIAYKVYFYGNYSYIIPSNNLELYKI